MPISAKQRQSLPANRFGEPKSRLFPVRVGNQSDFDSAVHLIGKAKDPEAVKKRLMRIAKRDGLTIPDTWKSETDSKANMSRLVATFKAEPSNLSFNQRRDLLSLALCDCFEGGYYLVDLYDTYLVACEWDRGGGEYNTITYTINPDYSVDFGIPQCVQPETIYHPVADPDDESEGGDAKASMTAFSLAAFKTREEDGFRIYDDANLFKLGDYPDKDFSLSEYEAECAIGRFEGTQQINLEHAPAMLVGKLGEVRDIWVDGDWIKGEVALPLWLDDQLTDAERQVSAEWTLTDKRLVGLALTPTPRIEGAALMTAFTARSERANDSTDKSQTPVVTVPVKEGSTTRKDKTMSFWKKMEALFTKAGINVDEEFPEATPPKVEETAEFKAMKEENERLKAVGLSVVAAKRTQAESAAVVAFGQNTAKFTAAKSLIDQIDSPAILDGLISTYSDLRPETTTQRASMTTGQQESNAASVSFGSAIAQLPDASKAEMVAAFASTGSKYATEMIKKLKEEGKL